MCHRKTSTKAVRCPRTRRGRRKYYVRLGVLRPRARSTNLRSARTYLAARLSLCHRKTSTKAVRCWHSLGGRQKHYRLGILLPRVRTTYLRSAPACLAASLCHRKTSTKAFRGRHPLGGRQTYHRPGILLPRVPPRYLRSARAYRAPSLCHRKTSTKAVVLKLCLVVERPAEVSEPLVEDINTTARIYYCRG